MTVAIQTEAPPLRQDSSGTLRIGDSRVLLEIVIRAFQDGATPEAIFQRYPTLKLSDVYSVISYFLRHTDDIASYLEVRERQATETQGRIEERRRDLGALRQRLLARRGA